MGKLLVVDVDAPGAPAWRDVSDVPVERVSELREWFRRYKTAEGKGLNKFGLGERSMPAEYALAVAMETHEAWRELRSQKSKCDFDGTPCWIGEVAEASPQVTKAEAP